MENETAPATEKRPKKPKNKTAESAESIISTHFSGFPLYQFRCCDVHRYSEIDTIQRCTPQPYNDAPSRKRLEISISP